MIKTAVWGWSARIRFNNSIPPASGTIKSVMTISIGYCSSRSSAFSVVSARSARKPDSVATCPQISRVGGSSSTMRTVLGAESAGDVPVSTCVSIQPPDTEFNRTSNGGRQWEEGHGHRKSKRALRLHLLKLSPDDNTFCGNVSSTIVLTLQHLFTTPRDARTGRTKI